MTTSADFAAIPKADASDVTISGELRVRNRQLTAIAALGQHAIRAADLEDVLKEAARLVSVTLRVKFSAIGQRLEGGRAFRLRAGTGWDAALVGATFPSDETPAAHVLESGEPLIIPDLRAETRFAVPPRLIELGITSSIYVLIRGRDLPWGNLSAYRTDSRAFSASEVGFLESIANVVALSVERSDVEAAHRREREVLQAIFANIPVMIALYEEQGRIQGANRAWEKTLGWTVAEAQERDMVAEGYPTPDASKAVFDFLRGEEERWVDFQTRTKDGRTLETSWAKLELSDGSRIGFGLDLTERKRAEVALRESNARFARLFEASPAALVMTEAREARVADVNEAWLRLFGYRREEVVGGTNTDLNLSIDPEVRTSSIARLVEEGSLPNTEMKLRHKSGAVLDVILSTVLLQNADGAQYWLSAITDITESKRAQTERDRLLAAEKEARAEAEAALDRLRAIAAITDSALMELDIDDLLRELLGRLRQSLGGEGAAVMLVDETKAFLYPRAWDGPSSKDFGSVRLPIGHGVSGRIVRERRALIIDDASTIDYSAASGAGPSGADLASTPHSRTVIGAPLQVGGRILGTVVLTAKTPRRFSEADLELLRLVADRVTPALDRARMVDEMKRAQQRLGTLSRRLLTAQEEERRRVAVELHDELGQLLTAVKINLESIDLAGTAAAQKLASAIASVDESMHRVRDLALDLRPSVLDDLGLPPALRFYADRFARSSGITVHVSIDAVPDLDPQIETACFRVAQEALTNVARHAHAQNVWLDLRLTPLGIELRVRDDGAGFDLAEARLRARRGESMGLLGMEERVSLAGGDFEVQGLNGGAEVRARFPVGDGTRSRR